MEESPADTAAPSDSFEARSHAFVVKIWLEESASGDHPALWRGRITHAYSGERQHVQDIDGIVRFISRYLARWQETPPPGDIDPAAGALDDG